MKRRVVCVLWGLAVILVPPAARAQEAPPATLAVSREVTLHASAPHMETLAVSREVTLHAVVVPADTLAVSREVTLYREFLEPDVLVALRIAAGFASPTPAQVQHFNIVTDPPSAEVIDLSDATAIAARAFRP